MLKKQLWLIFSLVGVFWCWHNAEALGYISINYGYPNTFIRQISLYLSGPEGVQDMKISNDPDLLGGVWEPFKNEKVWFLDYGKGTKSVYVKFRSATVEWPQIYSAHIYLNVPDNLDVDFSINNYATTTNDRSVGLSMVYNQSVESVLISNSNDFSGSTETPIHQQMSWTLPTGNGTKTVLVKFKDAANKTKVVSKKIIYNEPVRRLQEGLLIKGQSSTVYYLGYDNKIHPFTSNIIYRSWFKDYSNVTFVSDAKLKQYSVGQPVCVRPGTWLVKFSGLPKIYAVEPGCVLRPMMSDTQTFLLYGKNWKKRVLVLDPLLNSFYNTISYSVADSKTGVIDADRDGVPLNVEEENDTSDNNSDTDGDGLSDYEEIYYWFSDPVDADTNHKGTKDGLAVLNGYTPLGIKISVVPTGTYYYALGSVMKNKIVGKYYYRNSKGDYCPIGNSLADANFGSYNFSSMFAIDSPYTIDFPRANCGVSGSKNELTFPTVKNGNSVVSM